MRRARLEDMTGGWFVGDFSPTVLRTSACEVAVKSYQAGAEEGWHWQEEATELTAIVSGSAEMAGLVLTAGDVIMLEPGEQDASGFRALTDVTLVAVKLPSLPNDKRTATTQAQDS